MTRNCPICDCPDAAPLYKQTFSDHSVQSVVTCSGCGMGYASVSPAVDYDADSKYAVVEAIGSGENERERRRLDEMARLATRDLLPTVSILDIGCARGGMMEALGRAGYANSAGIDPSADCVAACHAKGLRATQGTFDSVPIWKYDLVILSHVLEHVWDVRAALLSVRDRMQPKGRCYIEVPNAQSYVHYLTVPYLDFNREHVNHFSASHLQDVFGKTGLRRVDWGDRGLETPHGIYPAIWAIAEIAEGRPRGHWIWSDDGKLRSSLLEYGYRSAALMEELERKLSASLDGRSRVILWGYGEFAQQLLRTELLERLHLAQVIDHDPRKQGLKLRGTPVEQPWQIRYEYPILIASIVNKDSIVQEIKAMGLKNPVVTL